MMYSLKKTHPRVTWVQLLILPLSSFIDFGKLLHVSVPLFFICEMKRNVIFTGLYKDSMNLIICTEFRTEPDT